MVIKTVEQHARYHTINREGFDNIQFSDSGCDDEEKECKDPSRSMQWMVGQ